MGQGIDAAARAGSPIHAQVLDDLKDQLLIVLLRRLGALEKTVVLPIGEVDDTGGLLCSFRIDPEKRQFEFSLELKQ